MYCYQGHFHCVCILSVAVHIVVANLGELSTLEETIRNAFSKVTGNINILLPLCNITLFFV